MVAIEDRGPCQFRVKIRCKGVSEINAFETRSAAEEWARIMEGKVTGDEYQAGGRRGTQYCPKRANGSSTISPTCRTPRASRSKLRYRQSTEFASWSLLSLRPADLIRWRRDVLDEDGGGEDAEVSVQTVSIA